MAQRYAAPGSPTVLIIHRRDCADGYAKFLKQKGYVVSEAYDSDAGVAAARTSPPNLIILDWALADATLPRLKEHELTRRIPVVALTEAAVASSTEYRTH